MLDYMRDGGFNMYVMLVTAIFVGAYAATRPIEKRSGVLKTGCVVLLMQGMLGIATGLQAVSSHYSKFPDKVEAIGTGLGELSNNGTFAAILFVALGVAALVTEKQAAGKARGDRGRGAA